MSDPAVQRVSKAAQAMSKHRDLYRWSVGLQFFVGSAFIALAALTSSWVYLTLACLFLAVAVLTSIRLRRSMRTVAEADAVPRAQPGGDLT